MTIRTHALPVGAVIRYGPAYVYERLDQRWIRTAEYTMVDTMNLAMLLPVALLFTPEEERP